MGRSSNESYLELRIDTPVEYALLGISDCDSQRDKGVLVERWQASYSLLLVLLRCLVLCIVL